MLSKERKYTLLEFQEKEFKNLELYKYDINEEMKEKIKKYLRNHFSFKDYIQLNRKEEKIWAYQLSELQIIKENPSKILKILQKLDENNTSKDIIIKI